MKYPLNKRFLDSYYMVKPFIPRGIQLYVRRKVIESKRSRNRNIWPINETASKPPVNWRGWPYGKRFALVLTHDVETENGYNKFRTLLKLEKNLGFLSSYNFVARKYNVSMETVKHIQSNNFEIGVHGLYHDGKYFKSREEFEKRAKAINHYLKKWGAVGFRAPAMHHNLDWISDLDILYDASTFDTDPFEPQSDGMKTIFPFWYQSSENTERGYVELPYTLPQDFTLFILLREKTINIWEKKLDWIAANGGMALLNVHPDYMNFDNRNSRKEEYQAEYYMEFLEYLSNKYKGEYWNPLPKDLAMFWINTMVKRDSNLQGMVS
jgi:hypothetical protein